MNRPERRRVERALEDSEHHLVITTKGQDFTVLTDLPPHVAVRLLSAAGNKLLAEYSESQPRGPEKPDIKIVKR